MTGSTPPALHPEPGDWADGWMDAVAARAEARLAAAGVELTLGGEPTYIPLKPEGPEWSVAADGPTKLTMARALADAIEERAWQGATQLLCPGKVYEGETNPRWALRLLRQADGSALTRWPEVVPGAAAPGTEEGPRLLEALAAALGCRLQPLRFRDPLEPARSAWAILLTHPHPEPGGWSAAPWDLPEPDRLLLPAPGPAGLRLPLQRVPEGVPRQVLTLEIGPDGWQFFLPPLAMAPWLDLLDAIAGLAGGWSRPRLGGVMPFDVGGRWQVLGLTADPGVLEVNLPVCARWRDYAGWLQLLEEAGAAVGLRSWRAGQPWASGTGGGNHLLWGGPSLERNPFFRRPHWLAAILRFWQRHPALSYGFGSASVGPSSQCPRADEGSARWEDLELAQQALLTLPEGDQRVMIGETLRHLQADRSGNTHRSEISLDKFWNPAWTAGCQGLIEFRAIETTPQARWSAAIALLWTALAAHLLDSERAPALEAWGEALHDRMLLPSVLRQDLGDVLERLRADGLALEPGPFDELWDWRCPVLLNWRNEALGAELEIRAALEPWPLICDTPVEGGLTSRFVDSSIRRIEIRANAAGRQHLQLQLNGHPIPLDQPPLAVRYRAERLYPCLHPLLPVHLPLDLELRWPMAGGEATRGRRYRMERPNGPFLDQGALEDPAPALRKPLRPRPGSCCIDLRRAAGVSSS
ncbi:hypothetical protein EVJ50_10745 [Synechococcus sp. RSCCF101]|uniref:transglutaminase family protein n=1 Tax=Synechococcus sp. RSCCF101 TaxID=2511069 RepID=UPI0012447895|nr:transglutaminase family protein [Synechococcus sp. RSCCF101]QEY32627.1 hypothetical protein EVJ50_10745 [Synechococcus sp. RSCCF101]